jgi:hypothetical protein
MMRTLTAALLSAAAIGMAAPANAADIFIPPPSAGIDIPNVDYGYAGSMYLRGSLGGNAFWARYGDHYTLSNSRFDTDKTGFGFSVGGGLGYETGTGLRMDVTADYLHNDGLAVTIPAGHPTLAAGAHKLKLRSTLVLANAYYDFGFSDGYGAAGGAFGYVGAGAGVAINRVFTEGPGLSDTWGGNTSFAAAGMVGLGYDFGQVVADVGYRAVYINRIENAAPAYPYRVDDSWTHEVRGTVRYRFN